MNYKTRSYKAITLHQPYASLIGVGAKRYETRSWGTKYRGPIAIHAAKNTEVLSNALRDLFGDNLNFPRKRERAPFAYAWQEAMQECGMWWFPDNKLRIPIGSIVAIAQLTDCIIVSNKFIDQLNEKEKLFGWFAEYRFAWQLDNVRLLDIPIPVTGKQRLWNWNPEVEFAISSR
jgi:activating signal cointegrator 1